MKHQHTIPIDGSAQGVSQRAVNQANVRSCTLDKWFVPYGICHQY